MKLFPWLVSGIAMVVASFVLVGTMGSSTKASLPIYTNVPNFELETVTATKFNVQNLHGKLSVVNFFFSSCKDICPMMHAKISSLVKRLHGNQMVQFVSITIDPENDNSATLGEYAAKLRADSSRWHFLTGDRKAIEDLSVNGFKLALPNDENLHSIRLVLLDREARIRGYYSGLAEEELTQLEKDIERLARNG